MSFVRVFGIGLVLILAAISIGWLPATLPHPACHHTVQRISSLEQPGQPIGEYYPNTALQSATRLLEGRIHGSESVAVSPSGERLFMADKFGRIHVAGITQSNNQIALTLHPTSRVIQLEGRALGIHAVNETAVLVCDAVNGLLSVDIQSNTITTIADHVTTNGTRITLANDLDLSEEGIVYFTDSADIPVMNTNEGYYTLLRTFQLNLAEGRASGRLLSYDPTSNTTSELISSLWYANGVAVSADGAFVAVVESARFRIRRYWLNGPKAKRSDLLISNLPGFPYGISKAPDGNFWITLFARCGPGWKLFRPKIFRLIYAWMTEYLPSTGTFWGYVMKVSPEGKVLQVLSDREGGFVRMITCAVERDEKLFMGHMNDDYVSVFDLNLIKKEGVEIDVEYSDSEEL